MDKIAIVILNWNGREMLYRYLSSVVRYSCNEASIYRQRVDRRLHGVRCTTFSTL